MWRKEEMKHFYLVDEGISTDFSSGYRATWGPVQLSIDIIFFLICVYRAQWIAHYFWQYTGCQGLMHCSNVAKPQRTGWDRPDSSIISACCFYVLYIRMNTINCKRWLAWVCKITQNYTTTWSGLWPLAIPLWTTRGTQITLRSKEQRNMVVRSCRCSRGQHHTTCSKDRSCFNSNEGS